MRSLSHKVVISRFGYQRTFTSLASLSESVSNFFSSEPEPKIEDLPCDGNPNNHFILHNAVNDSKVHLVGTNHVYQQSSIHVKNVIHEVSPDCVALELCQPRMQRTRLDTKNRILDLHDNTAALPNSERYNNYNFGYQPVSVEEVPVLNFSLE